MWCFSKLESLGNFPNFTNCKFLGFGTMQIFRIFQKVNFVQFPNCKFFEFYKLNLLWNILYPRFLNFPNWNFFELSKFEVFGIVQIGKLRNFEIFFNLENQSLAPKIGSFEIARPFDIPHYSQFCQFSYFPSDIYIYQFRCFNFSTFISYPSENFLDQQIYKIIKFLKSFNFEN